MQPPHIQYKLSSGAYTTHKILHTVNDNTNMRTKKRLQYLSTRAGYVLLKLKLILPFIYRNGLESHYTCIIGKAFSAPLC